MSIIIHSSGSTLIKAYNQQNNRVLDARGNPYEGKISQEAQQDKELYKSSLGTPVLANLKFVGERYINADGKEGQFGDIILDTVLMNVSLSKNIVKTSVPGRSGTVKEYIGEDDAHITINGIITGGNGHHPADEIRALKNMLDANIPIRVVSRYLNHLDIDCVIIESWDMVQDPGGYSYQKFTINCISDTPIELQII